MTKTSVISKEREYNKRLGNKVIKYVSGVVSIDGREYNIGREYKKDCFSFYDSIDGSRHEFFGSPYLDIINIHTIYSEVYLLGTFDGLPFQLYDFFGNPFCRYGGIFTSIRDTIEFNDRFYLIGVLPKEDRTLKYNVFGPGGSTPFGSSFHFYDGFVRSADGLKIRAKRKIDDCMYTYGFGGIAKIGRDGSFYRVAQELHDIDGNPIYLCQKTIDDQLFLYDKEGKPFLEDVPIDEDLVGKLDHIYLERNNYKNYRWNGKSFDGDGMATKILIERYGLRSDYDTLIDVINYLGLGEDHTKKLMVQVELVLDNLLDHYRSKGEKVVYEQIGSRLKGMAQSLRDLPPDISIQFMGAS